MKIFEQEKLDGLQDLLSATASISYASAVSPCDKLKSTKNLKSIASFNDDDLYYVQSILVSSSWNKNDDIFDKAEVWNARNTPEDKPTNLEHDESLIIGHIVSNWPITEDGILIDENTPIENLPDKYHILTGSVIYKAFSSPELRERSEKLIAEIENGQKYVSMECLFKGFDYGLLNKANNEYKILARNNETAYLTKYLRAYGGLGEHQDYKIGRVLRNITFTGKGFVDKPANEDSIIFSKNLIPVTNDNPEPIIAAEKNCEIDKLGVLNFQSNKESETLTMSSAKTETTMEDTQAETVSEVNTVALELTSKVEELTASNETLKSELQALAETKDNEIKTLKEEAAKKMEDKEEEAKKMKAAIENIQNELNAANELVAAYKTKEEEMMKKEKKNKRMASLVSAGVDNATAEATVDKFDSLDDDAFDAMTSLFAGKMPPWLEKKKEEEDKTEKKKASEEESNVEADPSVLETAEVEANINLAVGSNDSESALESARAELVEFVCSKIGKKNNK
jgi:intracellular sulfur oxidation DsrE/DsrF family protein